LNGNGAVLPQKRALSKLSLGGNGAVSAAELVQRAKMTWTSHQDPWFSTKDWRDWRDTVTSCLQSDSGAPLSLSCAG